MSDDDWDAAADDGVVAAVPVDRWAGEDEEDGVAESWDEDPDEKKRKAQAAAAANANKAPQGPVLSQRKKKALEEEEKKRKEKEAAEAETDPALQAARKADETARALKRDAALAASLLGVDLSDDAGDGASSAAISERDAGNDIAAGGDKVSAEELARIGRGGGALDDFNFDSDASVDKLAALLAKRATDLPSNAKNSARLLRFLKSLTDTVCNPMKLDDVAELRRSITAKHNELTVRQKAAQKGKKAAVAAAPGSKKANTVKVATGGGSAGRNTYTDELDDYGGDEGDDFM